MTWNDLTAEERLLVNRTRVRAFEFWYISVQADYLIAARAGAIAVVEYLRKHPPPSV